MRKMTEQEMQEAKMFEEWAKQGKKMKVVTLKMKKAAESYKEESKKLESCGSFTIGKWEGRRRKY